MRCEITLFEPIGGDRSRTDVVVRLIDVIYRYYGLDGVMSLHNLPDWAGQDFSDLLAAAGFEIDGVVRGQIRQADIVVNDLCPFKAVKAGRGDVFATGWLNAMVRLVAPACAGNPMSNTAHQKLTEQVREEIARSRPLEPILLTQEGDELVENPPSPQNSNYLVGHTRDETELLLPKNSESLLVGVHRYCEGRIYRHRATRLLDALVCCKCHLRVPMLTDTYSFDDLRDGAPVAQKTQRFLHRLALSSHL